MKILRYIAFALGGIAALLVAGGLFVYATFDAAKLKSELTQIVREKKQRELAIDGDLALSFWPSIGVRLGHARLSEHASAKPFAAIESARISLALIPLFSKQVVIDRLELAGVDATIVRGKDGKLNIDDLLAKDEQPQQTEDQAVRFDIAAVDIERARLAWRDEKTGQTASISELDLATGKIANQARGRLEMKARLVTERPAANAAIALEADYDIDLDRKRYALAATDLELKGDLGPVSKLDLTLAAAALGVEAGGALHAEKLRLAGKGALADETLEIKLEAPKLQADADKASGEAVNLALRLAGAKRSIDARLDIGGAQGTAAALKIDKLALAVDAKLGETNAKAAIATPLAANLQAMTFDLAKIAGELTLASAQMPLKSLRLPLDGELHADLAKQTASARLAARLDESSMRAKLSVARFAPLALGFDVDVDRINVDKYLPPSAPDARKDKEAADKPIDLSALKGLDATGAVRIGALQVSGIKATNVKLEIKAANGKLEIAPHSAALYDGTLNGALSIDANGNRVVAKETLANVNIDPLLRDVAHKDLLEGRGSVTLDVATSGASVKAMKRALGGSARIALRDGAVKGINIAKTLRQYKAVAGMKEGVAQKAVTTEKTDFTEMSASFRIAKGIAHNDDLIAKSPLLRLTGSGDIDIAENRIDYLAKATVVNTSTGQEGKELANLKGVTVPVRLTGPFDALAWQLDYAAIATELAKAKVDEATRQIQQKAQEKVQEKVQEGLKGIFGR